MDSFSEDDYLDESDCHVMYTNQAENSDSDEPFQFPSAFRRKISRKLSRKKKPDQSVEDSSEDEFEKDMSAELNDIMMGLASSSKPKGLGESSKKEKSKNYDDIYFDSDSPEEDNDSKKDTKKKNKKRVLSNDELLYDPSMDEDDQAWVDANRLSYQVTKNNDSSQRKLPKKPPGQPEKMPNSDAVLNCPACFSTLCLDCQRHSVYQNQYRAMFVFNCRVDATEILLCPLKTEKQSKKRKKPESEPLESSDSKKDEFHPVRCAICNTKVAVYDQDEVYHFFNVLSSF